MQRAEFFDYIRLNGFKVADSHGFGVVNGYPVSVTWVNKRLVQLQLAAAKEQWKEHKKELNSAFKGKGNVSFGADSIYISLKLNDSDDLLNRLKDAVNCVKNLGIRDDNTCPICKMSGCDTAAFLNGAYRTTHSACLDTMLTDKKAKFEDNTHNGNYITGIIGAILGMLIGTIPSFFTIVWMNTIYALLFALIPLFAYHGYRLLRGKMNKFVIVLSIIMGIAGVYVLNFALLGYNVMTGYGLSIVDYFTVLPIFLSDTDVWISMTTDSIVDFFFVIVGIAIVWKQITRTSATEIRDAEKIRDTALPYGNAIMGDYMNASDGDE